jgi:hypothetical protein
MDARRVFASSVSPEVDDAETNDGGLTLSVYESYDSDPPSETSRRNDFGITTSLGWSFN